MQVPIPTLPIPTVPIPTIHIRQNASEKAQLRLNLTLTLTLAQTLTPDHNTNPDPSPNPLHYPFRNVGIAVVGIAAVGIVIASQLPHPKPHVSLGVPFSLSDIAYSV